MFGNEQIQVGRRRREPGNRAENGLFSTFSRAGAVGHVIWTSGPVMTATCVTQPRVLVADDQPDLLDALRLLLKAEGIHIEAVTSPDEALSQVATRSLRVSRARLPR